MTTRVEQPPEVPLVTVERSSWDELARQTRVFPTVCFNLNNSHSGTAGVDAILDMRETAAGVDGRRERHWLVRTDLHHPLVRIVDTVVIDSKSGMEQVVHRVSMAADHAVVSFSGGWWPESLAKTGVTVLERLHGTDFYLLGFSAVDAEALPKMLAALRSNGDLVASADADFLNYAADLPNQSVGVALLPDTAAVADPTVADGVSDLLAVPNDASFGSLWGMRNTGQMSGAVAGMDINAVNAWNVRTDASSVIVGVIDTGIRTTHQDLAANIWVNPGEIGLDPLGRNKSSNGIDDDNDGYVDDVYGINSITNSGLNPGTTNDDHGHGTHVSGTIGGSGNNGLGVAGVCWRVQLMALKFLNQNGSGYDSDAVKCLAYARSKGAKLTSNSWGGGGYSSATLTAIQQTRDADMLFVAAAGNSAANNDAQPMYPCGYNVENVISVASMNADGSRSSFSCYGATAVDLAAPGAGIYSCGVASDTAYATMSGTSMATPHVAGVCALMRAQLPTMSYAEIASRLFHTATAMPVWNGVVATGGRVDAYRAIGEALPQLAQGATGASAKRGAAAVLSVAAIDPLSGSLSYQWRRAGVTVSGANGSSYTITNLQQNKTGYYDCLVTNATGTVASGTISVTLRGGADFDGNGTPDLIWTQANTGRRILWLMNGPARLTATPVELGTVSIDWTINGAADFDGNGTPDLIWTQASTGRRILWLMNGPARLTPTPVELGTVSIDWTINGAADFDGNGTPDLVWTQASTGRRILWLMNGTSRLTPTPVDLGTVLPDWTINGAADFDGNGTPDLIWTQASTGRRILWLMNGTSRLTTTPVELGVVATNWRIEGMGDFDGNGRPDIIWTDTYSGRRILWLMNGTTRLTSTPVELGTAPLDWSICGR